MDEVWKDITGYEGLYAVSSHGRVKSYYVNRILKPQIVRGGYYAVKLSKNRKKEHKYVHILVAEAFIPNENNLPVVNHKDETRTNNLSTNLEWCTVQYNNTYNDVHLRRPQPTQKKVFQYNKDGELCNTYPSTRAAGRHLNKSSSNISSCCNEQLYTYCGFVWSYNPLSATDVMRRFQLSRETSLSQKNNRLSKSVSQLDLDGNFICSYPSTQEAGRQLHISPSLIQGVCNDHHKYTHGFVFKYN